MKNILLLLLSVSLFSCQKKENMNPVVETSDTTTVTKKKNTEENKQIGDTIFLKYQNEKGFYTAEGILDSVHQRIYLKFNNDNSGELNARIIPETGKGNIRFNQIIFPDNTSDGPFGMNLKIPLTQKGNHIVVVGHSQMADYPYWGKFGLELVNKKE
ncbi:hypothetical protein [Flavobacterium sp.]|uniref:hypothetical protein n=1 Tax=Flavobacterium sp. TaxID=239 RepID=UPI0032631974